ncbi:hypothetical protein [Microbispora sp. NPDC049125]|uniref:hypothetical protein n=1 Tax=Microbispora sp. NPDC049125 TaxID=3154929 RepID=UPI00346558FD
MSDELVKALRECHPALSREQAEEAAKALIERAGSVIDAGGFVGEVSFLPGGDIEVTAYRLEHAGDRAGH